MTLTKKDATAESVRWSNMRDGDHSPRKAYEKPRVRPVGRVEQAIMSPTPGSFESGPGGGFQP
jgi:hypothetical protein